MRSRIMLDRWFLSEVLRSTTEQSCGEVVVTMRVSSCYVRPQCLRTSAPRRMNLGSILDFLPYLAPACLTSKVKSKGTSTQI